MKFAQLDFQPAGGLRWLNDSTLVVGDAHTGEVVLLGADGHERRRIGRRGAGPGEYLLPFSLLATSDGGLLVADSQLRRISRLDPELNFVESVATPGTPFNLLRVQGTRALLLWIGAPGEGPRLSWVDLQTGASTPLFEPFSSSAALERSSLEVLGMRSDFVASATADDHGILLGGGAAYEIVVFDETGREVRRFGRRDSTSPVPTAEEVEAYARSLTSLGMTGGEAAQVRDRLIHTFRETPKPFFGPNGLAVDAKGRTWVATLIPGTGENTLDLFAPDGRLLSSFGVPRNLSIVAVRLPRVALLGMVDGVPSLRVFELDEP